MSQMGFNNKGMVLDDLHAAALNREERKNAQELFQSEYTYGSVINDRKTCIYRGDKFSWEDESSGTPWVGVHGGDSICVVTRHTDLDAARLSGSLLYFLPVHNVFFEFRKTLIVEIEDLEDASSELRQRFNQKIEKPFGVVSVIPFTDKAPGIEHGEMKAIEFLREKLNGDTILTLNETIQTAVSAFQQLFQREFKPDEIQVSVMDPNYTWTPEAKEFDACDLPSLVSGSRAKTLKSDLTVEELDMGQIKEHLDVINKPALHCHKRKVEHDPEDLTSEATD